MAAPAFPKQFGKYTLLRKLATGGMAELFIAKVQEDDGSEREVVVKRILPSFSEDEAFVKMFIDEASLTAKLQHPNIVQIYDFDVTDRQYYIAMEYIEGEDLQNLMKDGVDKGSPLSVAQCVWIVVELAKGLHYAHTKEHKGKPLNIIHRDVTPHNAMVSYDGDVKLMDFGIAKAAERSTKTQAGMVKGKVAYMSPEQARGKPLDPRSDLFALATMLWEMLTNKRLFLRASDFETLTAILKEEAEPPSKHRKGIDQELDDIIMTALEKDREHRQASVEVFARELNRWYYKNVSSPEAETARAFMRKVYADKIAKLGGRQAEPATVKAVSRSSVPVPEPVKKGELRRNTNRMDAAGGQANESPSTLKLNEDVRSEKGPGRTVEASAPEVLKAKPPRRAQKPAEPEFAAAATILEDSGLSQAELMKALQESQRKKAGGEAAVAGPGKKPATHEDGGGKSNAKLLILLAVVALAVGGVLAFVLTR
ncbi:MAG: serine/threonine protein kinase [Deltaproteobacteria bacterium]|nr:serine/threonine protein kinase [Deltaproteobacteria bacterium]